MSAAQPRQAGRRAEEATDQGERAVAPAPGAALANVDVCYRFCARPGSAEAAGGCPGGTGGHLGGRRALPRLSALRPHGAGLEQGCRRVPVPQRLLPPARSSHATRDHLVAHLRFEQVRHPHTPKPMVCSPSWGRAAVGGAYTAAKGKGQRAIVTTAPIEGAPEYGQCVRFRGLSATGPHRRRRAPSHPGRLARYTCSGPAVCQRPRLCCPQGQRPSHGSPIDWEHSLRRPSGRTGRTQATTGRCCLRTRS